MAKIYGLDFGTTNSLASVVVAEQMLSLVNEEDQLPHPSVIRYHGDEVVVGRAAKNTIDTTGTGVIGDYVRSPKTYLGSYQKIHVGGVARDVSDVIAKILAFVKNDACQRNLKGEAFENAIMTIPVNSTGRARRQLREAALKAGIHVHQFVQEPFAALYGFLRSRPDFQRQIAELEGRIILVFDWGGGTLDLTLCKISKGMMVQVQSKGDNTVGGDRFDERLIRYARNTHIDQYGLDDVFTEFPNSLAKLIAQCEMAKIGLSDRSNATIAVAHYMKSDGPDRTLEVSIDRELLVEMTKDIVLDGMRNIDQILESSGINEASIAQVIATGGMVRMPFIRELLLERFDPIRVPKLENGERIISQGAAWIAHDEVRQTLAKPFEVLLGNDDYVTLIEEKHRLPIENEQQVLPTFTAYCTDPRDGYGKLQFARPVWPDRSLPGDPRRTYATLFVAVDNEAAPLTERIELIVTIDHDLVASVGATSTVTKHSSAREIHNLEFGLSIGSISTSPVGGEELVDETPLYSPIENLPGAIRFRSNITLQGTGWDCVPGELIPTYLGQLSPEQKMKITKRQKHEERYYIPCSFCNRLWFQIRLEGSESCRCRLGSVTEEQANNRRLLFNELQIRISNLEDKLNSDIL